MGSVRMQTLLEADEDRLLHTLRANETIEKSRDRSLETLEEELGSLLLRYNAACAPDRMRQALADGMAAAVRDCLGLLKAGGAEKESSRRETSGWAPLLLLLAVGAAVAAVLLFETARAAALACAAGALIAAFAAGLGWFRRQETRVRPTLDPDRLWQTVKRTGETMDRKIDAFCERAEEWPAAQPASGAPGEEELALFGDLLEALYADNGEFALRQLEKLRPCLRSLGIEIADYSEEDAGSFELFPSLRPGLTLRPALKAEGKLLLMGKATEKAE